MHFARTSGAQAPPAAAPLPSFEVATVKRTVSGRLQRRLAVLPDGRVQDASNVALLADAPWSLAPAFAIFVVVLGVNLVAQGTGRAPVQFEP